MRFMVIVKANKDSEAGAPLKSELLEAMGRFNEEMVKAGVMLAAEGLQPSSKGARIRFDHGKRSVIDGPFAETKELVGGFWLIQVKSKEEAIEWMKRCPAPSATTRCPRSRSARSTRCRTYRRQTAHCRGCRARAEDARRARGAGWRNRTGGSR